MMDIRNARRRANGDIDLEFSTGLEWLPFTARQGEPGLGDQLWRLADPIALAADPDAEAAAELASRRSSMAVSRFQARAALMQAGLLADVEAVVAADPDPFVQLAWAESIEFKRSSPTIATLAAAIGLTDTQVDQLFITASQISA